MDWHLSQGRKAEKRGQLFLTLNEETLEIQEVGDESVSKKSATRDDSLRDSLRNEMMERRNLLAIKENEDMLRTFKGVKRALEQGDAELLWHHMTAPKSVLRLAIDTLLAGRSVHKLRGGERQRFMDEMHRTLNVRNRKRNRTLKSVVFNVWSRTVKLLKRKA